jgi:hypothetical protein
MQTPHRIFKSEADQPKPLAYLRSFPQNRRRTGGYLVAAITGGALALIAAAALAMIASATAGFG